jgi:hypothetical protein
MGNTSGEQYTTPDRHTNEAYVLMAAFAGGAVARLTGQP